MLKKHNRITLSKDFAYILKFGKKVYSPYFLLVWTKTNSDEPTKIGFIASKKVGNAVMRNLSKRKFREVFRELYPSILNGFKIVVIASPEAPKTEYKKLKDSVEGVLRKASLVDYQDK